MDPITALAVSSDDGCGGASGIIVIRCGDTFAATNPLFKTGLVTLSINPAHTPGLKAGESNGFILHAFPVRIRGHVPLLSKRCVSPFLLSRAEYS